VLDLRRVRHVRGLVVGGRATIAGDRIATLRLRIRGGRRLVLRGRRIGRVRLSPARLTVPRPDVAASLAAGAGQRCR
jgi:hypothetical protein